jgi:hypothetical protein
MQRWPKSQKSVTLKKRNEQMQALVAASEKVRALLNLSPNTTIDWSN